MEKRVFVSYSRTDAHLLLAVVNLLRSLTGHVFFDLDTIPLGKRWKVEINTAITNAHMLLVFWCAHARSSTEVQHEYKLGIELGKDVLPVLLDDTALPAELRDFQYLDMQDVMAHSTAHGRSRAQARITRLMTVVVGLITMGFFVYHLLENVGLWATFGLIATFTVIVGLAARFYRLFDLFGFVDDRSLRDEHVCDRPVGTEGVDIIVAREVAIRIAKELLYRSRQT